MTIINANTKKGKTMLQKAQNNEGFSLWVVYENFSHSKYVAWSYCKDLCTNEHGTNFRIISHNSFQFSVAWETEEGTRIETANNSYLIKH